MSAAAVVVEIFVAGLGALVWVAMLLRLVFDSSALGQVTLYLTGWEQLGTALLLAFAYGMGVTVDRLADYLLSTGPVSRIAASLGRGAADRDTKDDEQRMRLLVLEKRATVLLDYVRSGVRVARATVFNVLLIVIFGSALAFREFAVRQAVAILVVGLCLVAVAFFVYSASDQTFRRLVDLGTKIARDTQEARPGAA